MKLIYAHQSRVNFGDALNETLWDRLVPGLLNDDADEAFLGIGTLVGAPLDRETVLHVFSSGAGYDDASSWHGERRVWCVRGPLTARLLGLDSSAALTDGALLAPSALGVSRTSSGPADGIAVVPHWQSLRSPGWSEACDAAGFRLVSPLDSPEHVHGAIARSRLVLVEALHAAICADSLGVPWIPFVTTANVSLFKWTDWCASVGVAFAPTAVPPPCADPLRTFGRPKIASWGERRTVDPEMAIHELRGRMRHSVQARTSVRAALRSAVSGAIAGHTRQYTPLRTAEALRALALAPPCLSPVVTRERLHAQLLERLHALATRATAALP